MTEEQKPPERWLSAESNRTTKPSIAELQRITRTTCPRCGGPAGKCAGAPRTIEEQAEDDAAIRKAAPALLEIAAAAKQLEPELAYLQGPLSDRLREALAGIEL